MNKVILIGRLTADPELKTTPSGISVTSFSIAVSRTYAKPDEERQVDFIHIVCWRQRAEFVCKYFIKGQLIALEGSIQTRKYLDKQEKKRTAFEVVADNVYFTGDRWQNQKELFATAVKKDTYDPNLPDELIMSDLTDDDLPF